jgi:hypothetical protein
MQLSIVRVRGPRWNRRSLIEGGPKHECTIHHSQRKSGSVVCTFAVKHLGDRAFRAGFAPCSFTVSGENGSPVTYQLLRCARIAGRNGMDSRESMTLLREGKQLDWAILSARHPVPLAPMTAPSETIAFVRERDQVAGFLHTRIHQRQLRDA